MHEWRGDLESKEKTTQKMICIYTIYIKTLGYTMFIVFATPLGSSTFKDWMDVVHKSAIYN